MHCHSNQKKKAYRKGQWSEKLSAFFLTLKGYEILESRYKTPVGEIDLIAKKHNTLVAVEVKHRKTFEIAAYSISPTQRKRIEQALLFYLRGLQTPLDFRFDVILISPWKWPYHIKGAWLP